MLDNVFILVVFYTSMNLPIATWMMRSFLAEVPGSSPRTSSCEGCRSAPSND